MIISGFSIAHAVVYIPNVLCDNDPTLCPNGQSVIQYGIKANSTVSVDFTTDCKDDDVLHYHASNSTFHCSPHLPLPIFAELSSTQNQLVNGINTATNVTLNSNDEILNMIHNSTLNNNEITINYTGIYYIIICGQVGQTSGGGGTHLLWLQKNGVNIANSGVATFLANPAADTSVVTLNWVGTLVKGDKISMVQQADDANIELKFTAASGSVPNIPSIIVSIRGVAT